MDAYQRYGPALLRKARRLLGNAADAEDIVHGLFIDILQKGDSPSDLPYLYRAVTNRCLTFIRDRDNRTRLLNQQEPLLRGAVRTRLEDRTVDLDLLAKLVERIDVTDAETLVYRFFDDLSLEEIADVMKVSRKTVGNRLARVSAEIAALDAATGDAQ
jgi:RNA polymerase sigma factor (sigma-70 family)